MLVHWYQCKGLTTTRDTDLRASYHQRFAFHSWHSNRCRSLLGWSWRRDNKGSRSYSSQFQPWIPLIGFPFHVQPFKKPQHFYPTCHGRTPTRGIWFGTFLAHWLRWLKNIWLFVLPKFRGLRGRTSGPLKIGENLAICKSLASFSNWEWNLFYATCRQIFSLKQTKKSSSTTRDLNLINDMDASWCLQLSLIYSQ